VAGLAVVTGAVARGVGRILDATFPATCAGCGREGPALCPTCVPALDARLASAPGVALGLPGELPDPLLQLEWCASFSGIARQALHHLKYGGEQRLAEPLGLAIARRWTVAGAGGNLIVPVPASPDRVRERGFDQAALIAHVAARQLGLPLEAALVRRRNTAAQFDLDRAARGSNVAGAFALAPGRDEGALKGSWIVLLDDVVTTGATLAACGRVLMEAGALGVSAVTVARER
jgi:ComF family protein